MGTEGLDYSATGIAQPRDSLRPRRRLIPAGSAFVIGIVALVVATLLNATALLETAEAQSVGSPLRTLAVSVMRPVASFSAAIGLHVPRRTIDQALGRDGGDSEPATILASPATPPVPSPPTSTTMAASPAHRRLSPEYPRRVYLAADSFGQMLGPSLVNAAAEGGLVDVEFDFQISSGLMRPDFYDWPAHVRERLPDVDPEVVIAMFGGNDGQETFAEGELQDIGSSVWIEVYTGRVAEMMDIFSAAALEVYWIGLPITGSAEHAYEFQVMNEIYRKEAEKRSKVTFLDIWSLFEDESGAYARYLRNDEGELVMMRAADHIHFDWAGAERLAGVVLQRLTDDRLLTPATD